MTNRFPVFTPFLVVLLCVAFAQAQEVVRKEPPPEIKMLVGDIVKAVNGTADDFEHFAQQRFAPELLKKHTAAERAALHQRLSNAFGQIGINAIRREGPDAPLLMQIKGDRSDGEISVELDLNTPPKIIAFDSDAGMAAAAPADPLQRKKQDPAFAEATARPAISSWSSRLKLPQRDQYLRGC